MSCVCGTGVAGRTCTGETPLLVCGRCCGVVYAPGAHLLRLTRLTRNRTIRIARCLCAALRRLHGNFTLFLLVLHEGESAAAQQQHDRNHDEDNQPAVAALVHHRVRRGCGGQRFERRRGRSGGVGVAVSCAGAVVGEVSGPGVEKPCHGT